MKSLLLVCVVAILHDTITESQEIVMMCPGGEVHDELSANGINFTCKIMQDPPLENITCRNHTLRDNIPFTCPRKGFVSGWVKKRRWIITKCCISPGLKGFKKSCLQHFNNQTYNHLPYKVLPGKFITAFHSVDGGKNWENKECTYSKRV